MSSHVKGREPKCPGQYPGCAGIVRNREAKLCKNCTNCVRKDPLKTVSSDAVESRSETATACEISKITAKNVRTLEDLIEVCEIDLEAWTIDRWVCNKWEMGYKDRNKEAGSLPLFQIKVWLKKRVVQLATRSEILDLIDSTKLEIDRRPRTIIKRLATTGLLFEPNIPDLHMGKLAWAKETGHDNYDTKLSKHAFEEALETLIQRVSHFEFERVVFPVGNDLLNADNMLNTTTGGTPQDSDVRFQKTFTTARYMMVAAIERLRELAPVDVVMVPGNHDQLSIWHLGDSLECYFHKYTDVKIDNDPRQRKYYEFGKVMLMFTHGDKGSKPDYLGVVATEQPEMWARTEFREVHCGHIHKVEVAEYHGLKVRVSPALCPPDAWHAEKHFVGNGRSAEAFVWSKDEGLINTAYYTIKRGT